VFVTGSTGFIGSVIVGGLIDAGHQVLGLARSAKAAAALTENLQAEVHRGALDGLDSLRSGGAASDGVIHTAYIHDFSDFAAAGDDRRATETLGEALAGSDRPLVVTAGTAGLTPGRLAPEDSVPDAGSFAALRFASEEAALSFAERGVRVSGAAPAVGARRG
jgi:nucleoside-diphosphate-sugar epimerase